MIDVNVYVGRWPFRRLPDDETQRLVERLRKAGVVRAWVGSFDALLHRDLAGVNTRLAAECREKGAGLLLPFGTVNPSLPDWEEDLRRCAEELGMPGIRLHPNYHGYGLGDPEFAELLGRAAELRLIVQIVAKMEDERTQHPLVRVPTTNLRPLLETVRQHLELPVVLLNALRDTTVEEAAALVEAGEIYFDVAMLEGVGGLGRLISKLPHERVMFGSLAPLFYFEAAAAKLHESEIGHAALSAVAHRNAERLLPVG